MSIENKKMNTFFKNVESMGFEGALAVKDKKDEATGSTGGGEKPPSE